LTPLSSRGFSNRIKLKSFFAHNPKTNVTTMNDTKEKEFCLPVDKVGLGDIPTVGG
jgi:hypothetical protein